MEYIKILIQLLLPIGLNLIALHWHYVD